VTIEREKSEHLFTIDKSFGTISGQVSLLVLFKKACCGGTKNEDLGYFFLIQANFFIVQCIWDFLRIFD
jgi:hypothetical protein